MGRNCLFNLADGTAQLTRTHVIWTRVSALRHLQPCKLVNLQAFVTVSIGVSILRKAVPAFLLLPKQR